MTDDNLAWLGQWYASQCDGDWEHSYGIKIDTLDNPGWWIKIDVTDTIMADQSFEAAAFGEQSEDFEHWQGAGSWWAAAVRNGVFEATCGPLDLPAIVGVFRNWVGQIS